MTIYAVWKGKGGQAWQDEALEVDCRSPTVEGLVRQGIEVLSVTR